MHTWLKQEEVRESTHPHSNAGGEMCEHFLRVKEILNKDHVTSCNKRREDQTGWKHTLQLTSPTGQTASEFPACSLLHL